MRALIRELIETVILALVIFLALQFSVQNFRVEGSSMQNTLSEGQYLLVNKIVYLRLDPQTLNNFLPFVSLDEDESIFPFHPPRRGEIIIFRFPGDASRDFVKRVIGVPGDVVEIRSDSHVFVNGEELDEPYITLPDRCTTRPNRCARAPVTVPPDSYYVLGDNRSASNDSRAWGMVPAENIIGKTWVSYWPLDQIQGLNVFSRRW